MKKYIFLFVLSLTLLFCSISSGIAADTTGQIDHDRPQDLTSCSIYYQKYEPAFYTGFAPRSRDPKRLHLHVGRGNQLRATLVLSDKVLESYLRDIFARYVTYQTMIDEDNLQLTQNSSFEKFEAKIESENLHNLIIAETEMSSQEAIQRNLQIMQQLNPQRVFHITTPVQAVISNWLKMLQISDFKKPDDKRKLQLLNAMLPTRLWLTTLEQDITEELEALLQQAADTKKVTEAFTSQYLNLLDTISGGIYSRTGEAFDFHEFTAIFPLEHLTNTPPALKV
jgi:hypothetical protein